MHIAKLVSRFFKLFIPSSIAEIAKSSGFMKRYSKLLPETFAKAMTTAILDPRNIKNKNEYTYKESKRNVTYEE